MTPQATGTARRRPRDFLHPANRAMRVALAASVALALPAAFAQDAGRMDEDRAAKAFATKPAYSPYAGRSYPTRPYFGSGIWANGEVAPGLWYNVMLSNSNSALGVKASQLDRKMTSGASVWWMPTTHEFGPRGAYGDWEFHDRVATRFGISAVQSPEQSFADFQKSPGNTTLRLADGVNLFETGSLAPGVTIAEADYRILSVDAGVKYRGAFLQAEFYERRLDNFLADGLLPVREIVDRGFQVQASFFPVPKVLELYALTSQIYGDDDAGFGDSSEYVVGANWYPFDTRNHRWNLQLMDINGSPVSSTFGYYTGGQDGITLATSFSIFF